MQRNVGRKQAYGVDDFDRGNNGELIQPFKTQ